MNFLQEWMTYGLIQQQTHDVELADHLNEARVCYAGFDPTADSLHIGHLLPLLALRRVQLAGHIPIVLIGGGTALIGDPSGKSQERNLQNVETVMTWSEKIQKQVERFIDFDKKNAFISNNYQWIGEARLIDFLRDIGKSFSVNAMLQKDSVKGRISREGEGISFTEFSYSLLQSFDFLQLFRRYQCTIQIGGSDQWGNIISGIDLIRRQEGIQVFGITMPLVTKADGTKFGKTESGTIWLDAEKTSSYQMYQFWLNTSDADVIKFIKYFTFLSWKDIAELQQTIELQPEKRQAQTVLAREVTRLVHGEIGLSTAEKITQAFFQGTLTTLSEKDLAMIFSEEDIAQLPFTETVTLLDLVLTAAVATSKSQARQLIQSAAISVNEERFIDEKKTFSREQALFGKYFLLRKGKKDYRLLRWLNE
jgi:tyrosyl-tRNA synthetase